MKTVWLIRHGEAAHNVAWHESVEKAANIRDPSLTERGRQQAQLLKTNPILFSAIHGLSHDGLKPEVCIVSPLSRTVETATIGLSGLGIPFVACEHFQECSDLPSDTGIPPSELEKRFPDVDFSGLPEEWYAKAGHYNFLTNYSCPQGQQLLWERMRVATQWLCDRPEKSLIIVAHHTVFTFLVGMEFHNCEVMKFNLAPNGDWRSRWTVTESDGEIMPIYKDYETRWTWSGSGELSGSLKTCLKQSHLGEDAALATLQKHNEYQRNSGTSENDSEKNVWPPFVSLAAVILAFFAIGVRNR